MNNIEAIIFDKDGTLIDFDAFWVSMSEKAMTEVLREFGWEEVPLSEVLAAFGVHNGVTDIEGIVCKGTYEEMGEAFRGVLQKYGHDAPCPELVERILEAYNRNSDAGEIRPTCPTLVETVSHLKERGIRLAVVTTDHLEMTHKCLRILGIEQYFEKIYADDGHTPMKPDPFGADDFSRFSGVPKERMLMVGDTMTDMNFAKNAGIRVVGVAKTEKNAKILAPHADRVVHDVSEIPMLLK